MLDFCPGTPCYANLCGAVVHPFLWLQGLLGVSTAGQYCINGYGGNGNCYGNYHLHFPRDTYPGPTDYDFTLNKTSWDQDKSMGIDWTR